MTSIVIGIVVFAVAVVLLSAGVILGKKTPLKGSCQVHGNGNTENSPSGSCANCTCAQSEESSGR